MSLVPTASLNLEAPVLAQIHRMKKEREARMRAAARAVAEATKPELAYEPKRTWGDARAELERQQRVQEAIKAKMRWRQSWARMVRLAFTMNDPHSSFFKIINEVSFKYGISVSELKGDRRAIEITQARHEICWRCAKETGLSLPLTGKLLGNKDHTTVLSGIKKYARLQRVKAGLEPARTFDRLIDWNKIIDGVGL